jgi:hypothetical protein
VIDRDTGAPSRARSGSRPGAVGALAGLVAIGCCVYPVVLVLLGLSSAAAAVDLGNRLFSEWGWAFKLVGLALVVSAFVVQRRRARACAADARPRTGRNLVVMLGVGVATYLLLYGVTTWLGRAAA